MKIRIWRHRSLGAWSAFHEQHGTVMFRQLTGDGVVKVVSPDEAREALASELQCETRAPEPEVLDEVSAPGSQKRTHHHETLWPVLRR
ncbi:hypothetical protein WAB73_003213 [Salmonella enterica subsp. enterica]